MHCLISWFEIPAQDLDRACQFYEKVLNCKIEIVELMGIQYGIIPKVGNVAGSIVKRDGLVPGQGACLFFYTTEMNATLERVMEAGGEIILEKTLLTLQKSDGTVLVTRSLIDDKMGYFSQFKDTEGNIMAFHSNS